jgi:SAM-dependent methyltransferase
MKLGIIPENILERVALAAGVVPRPILDTLVAMLLARTIMAATKLGIFEALASGPLPAHQVAAHCGTDPCATEKLLTALAGCGYVRAEHGQYALAPVARTWLLKDSPQSLRDKMLGQFTLEWEWIEGYEEFVGSGTPLDIHESMSDDEWGLYQRSMRALASSSAKEVARRTPVPSGARDMLDIGGSHGYYSVAICRRHPGLRAVILDLPEAVNHAEPILAREGMGDRVRHRAGNALTDDLGTQAWDLVFIANLVHHFDEQANRDLVRRIARALRPGGILVIQDFIRLQQPGEGGQIGALNELFFALTSQSGTWSLAEIAGWQQEAGLVPRKPRRLLTLPGAAQQAAGKEA